MPTAASFAALPVGRPHRPPGDTGLTPRQAAVLEFMVSHFREHLRLPTIREIAHVFGIASPNGIMCHLLSLDRLGRIRYRVRQGKIGVGNKGCKSRGYEVVGLRELLLPGIDAYALSARLELEAMPPSDESALIAAIERLTAALAAGEPALLTGPQAAAYLGYGVSKFYALESAGLIPCAVGFATDKPADKRWRRADLARCVAALKRHRVKESRS